MSRSSAFRFRFRWMAQLSVATLTPTITILLSISVYLAFFDPVAALSATNSNTIRVAATAAASIATNPVLEFKLESESPKPEQKLPIDQPTETSHCTPDQRSNLLNKHLRRELSAQQSSDGIENIGGEIMEAALLSARDNGYDPRFGKPALKTYRSFVYSDKHATDALLLNGLAIKTAKQIRNMIKQHFNLSRGIASPPKNEKLQGNPPQHFRTKIANSIAKGERRARERSHRSLREVCTGCSRPFNLCVCEVLNHWNNKTATNTTTAIERMVRSRVIVLQHPNEFRKKHTSTVPLLKLVLGEENVQIKVGYEFTMKDVLLSDENIKDVERPIMLFPGPDAMDLDKYVESQQLQHQQPSDILDSNSNPIQKGIDSDSGEKQQQQQKKHTLVLIDGTWSEAKRIIRKSPEILEGCQMVQFAFSDDLDEEERIRSLKPDSFEDDFSSISPSLWPRLPESGSDKATKSRSIYHAMRKEPEEHCLSTLEACGEALKILEGNIKGPKLQQVLTSVLSKHVELHLKNAREASQSRHNRDTTSRDSKVRRSKEIEQSIYGTEIFGVGDTNDSTANSINSNRNSKSIQGGSQNEENTSPRASQPATIAQNPTRLMEVDSNTSVTIRRLTHEDIPVIDAWWENGGAPKALMTITRSIDADYRLGVGASLGIVDEITGVLVACILRYESGPLGILHVSEELRGRGYGTALLREAIKAVSEANRGRDLPLEYTAFIKDGNTASERVFEKVGFVRENPNAKKGTGKRRANRKWIYPPRDRERIQ